MDSMALYRGLDIGTAKPTPAERARVRHHLIDVLDPWEPASVAWWLARAKTCCEEIEGRGKRVLIVGGTPLYLKALLCGLFDGPPADEALRRRLEAEAIAQGPNALHERLAHVDPAGAGRLHPNDQRRVIRALEVFELTGRPISAWQEQWGRSQGSGVRSQESGGTGREAGGREESRGRNPEAGITDRSDPCSLTPDPCSLTPDSCSQPPDPVLWLDLPRAELYDRINRRVEGMFAAGLADEVERLRSARRPLGKEASQALGYKEVLAYLEGKHDLAATVALVQTRTRNFAKRQITWFRHLPGCRPATSQLTWDLWRPKMNY
jgi:tRNA dimethylallyltransferase